MTANLTTKIRDRVGTRAARAMRAQGQIPVCLRGEGKDPVNLWIDEHQFLAARRHHEHVFALELGKEIDTVMVGELQWDPLGEQILHVDFRRVDLARETEAMVPLEFVGHPKGGVLNHLMAQVRVAAIPAKIPDRIEVKVDAMELGTPLLARDLVLPEGVRLVLAPETAIAVVTIVREEPTTPAEAAPAAEGEAVPGAEAAPAAAAAAGDKEKPAKPEKAEKPGRGKDKG